MSKKSKPRWPVWDRLVRSLHWSLVLLVVLTWSTGDTLGPTHERLGYGVIAVVIGRTVWGFVGGRYARFSQFVRGPQVTARYLREVVSGQAPRHLGHNPLGGWMVLALLGCAASLGLTGWLATTDLFWGYAWLAVLHESLAWLLIGLAALHVGGVVFTSWQHRENLVAAMLHGRKAPPQAGDID